MGRAERRKQEKLLREERKREDLYLKAQANKNRLLDEEIDRIQDKLTEMNLNAVFNAFALCLYERHGIDDVSKILEDLGWIDEMVGKVGSSEFPTYDDFKLYCASKTGVAIGLTEEQSKQLEQNESSYKFILMVDDDENLFVQKILILNEDDDRILVNCIGGSENGRVLSLDKNTDFYSNRKEAEHAINQFK